MSHFLSYKNHQTYHLGLRVFAFFTVAGPVTLSINAPHGRFSVGENQSENSVLRRIWSSLSIDGTIAWILMELPSPVSLLYAYSQENNILSLVDVPTPYTVLPVLFVAHYLNRAIISPLRTPSRSKSHVIVLISATLFNLLNGSLNGTWLGVGARTGKISWSTAPTSFYTGMAMFGLGLWGNIWHDEVLLQIRKSKDHQPGYKPRYAIPYGGLYSLVSFPNYLCEWFEWTGFSLAATSIMTPLQQELSLGHLLGISIVPPVLFTLVEIAVMLPRAIRGHEWYHQKFDDYPKIRKAVIPFLV
ncbi:3-oxo-5-alpha-steroid 4-dehydrogenase [Ceratobasidium sp. AG-Ba]|nr:3-oxo-5-alpha-steroid 4-dehydrogenase [Ceratobasidium sp. AG-Ba]QRW09717.1 3-oxo-5-alpha-steroid 4-dehydrogenase [Ceratobasidium sp. AG-Ba]